jgi:EmrB/QacA subfamily drug resistance transporter
MDSRLREASVPGDKAGALSGDAAGAAQAAEAEAASVAPGAPSVPSATGWGEGERLIALIVAAALFMQNLDGTVIATALPAMAAAFHADPVHMNVALTAYLFAVAVFVPASGWMADRYGTRQVFRAAIAVFTLGSVLCGRAETLPFLVFARVVQGVGGAMMLPVGRLILLRTIPKARLVSAMAWVTMPALVGPVIGPPLGGLILTYSSWRWIFDINVPIGIAGIVLASLYVPDRREAPGPFDLLGLFLSGAAFAAFLAVLELAGRGIVPPVALVALSLIAVGAGVYYGFHARSQTRPLLDFSLMKLPSFAISVIAGSLFRVGVGATPFLLPMMLQLGFGRTPLQSGMVTFAAAAGAIISKPGTQYVLRYFGFRSVLVVNGIVCALGLAVYAAFRADWPLWTLYGVLLTTGYLRSLQFTSYNTIAYAEVPTAKMSAATTLYSALQQISLTVGIPISAGVLHLVRAGHTVPRPADFSAAFLVVAAISLLAGPVSLYLPRNAGAEMSGKKS